MENVKLKGDENIMSEKNIVYVVTVDYGYDRNEFDSVWSTQEKAEERCKILNKGCSLKNPIGEWVDVEVDSP